MQKEFLGLLLDNNKLFERVYNTGNIFIDEYCSKIFTVMAELFESGIRITPESIEAKNQGVFRDEIINLMMCADSYDMFDLRYDRLKKAYLHRSASYIMQKVDNYENSEQFIKAIEDSITLRTDSGTDIKNAQQMHESLITRKVGEKTRTGLDFFDRSGGIRKAHLVIIGARPKTGKSSLMINLKNNAINYGYVPLVFSMEVPHDDYDSKLLACRTGIPSERIYDKLFTNNEEMNVAEEMDKTKNKKYFVSCKRLDINTIIRQIKYYKKKHNIDCVFIDHLHFIKSYDRGDRVEQLGNIVNTLAELKEELQITIYLLAQLNRESEMNPRPPRMSDLKGCGDIEQSADLIMLLHGRDYKEGGHRTKGYIDLYITNRYGPGGKITLLFEKDICRLKELKNHDEY
jgi:replicative DNA helicase